jgi:hypothetical protein
MERDGLPTEAHRVSLEGLSGEAVLQETRLHHSADLHRSLAPIVGRRWWGPERFHDYGGIPLALQSEEDVHVAYAEAYFPGQNRGRTAERYFKAPRDLTLELPPPLEPVEWSIQGTGEASRFEARWGQATGEASWYTLSLWDEPGRYRQWSTLVTPGWLGEGTGWSYAVPSFEGLEGFSTEWGLAPGTRALGSVVAVYANRPLAEAVMLLDGPVSGAQVDGLEVRTASYGVLLEGE